MLASHNIVPGGEAVPNSVPALTCLILSCVFLGEPESRFTYVSALIDSYSWAKSGRSRIQNLQSESGSQGDDPFTLWTDLMFQLKLANEDYRKALAAIGAFRLNETETVALSATVRQSAARNFSGL